MFLSLLYYLLFAANLICCYRQKKATPIVLISIAILGLMFYANDGSYGDHISYMMDFYSGERTREGDILYSYFMIAMKDFGIQKYQTFLLCIFLFELVFIGLGVKAFTTNAHALIAVSMFYIFPFFAVGLRYSMALAVAIFAMQFLFKKRFLIFAALITIASFFHICLASVVVLGVCFIKKLSEDKFYNGKLPFWPFLAIGGGFSLALFFMGTNWISGPLAIFINTYLDERGMIYLENGVGNGNGMLLLLPEYFFSVYLSLKILRFTQNLSSYNESCGEDYEYAKVNYLINVLSVVFYFLFCITPSYLRLLVIPTFTNTIMLGRLYQRKGEYSINNMPVDYSKINLVYSCFIFTWIIPVFFNMFGIGAPLWIETTLRYFR